MAALWAVYLADQWVEIAAAWLAEKKVASSVVQLAETRVDELVVQLASLLDVRKAVQWVAWSVLIAADWTV